MDEEDEVQEVGKDIESTSVKSFPHNTDKKRQKTFVAHEKRSAARSQLQAISQLAAAVNKLAEVNSKRLKVENVTVSYFLSFEKARLIK